MFHVKHSKIESRIEDISSIFEKRGIIFSKTQAVQFQKYEQEILNWNLRANLISKNDEKRIVERHFLESALLSKFELFHKAAAVLDIGSGGGFPGVPLKIVCSHLSFTLIEPKRWKVLFLKNLIEKLHLDGIEVVCERAEKIEKLKEYLGKFDIVVARAVAELQKLFFLAEPFINKKGELVAIKGSSVSKEIEGLKVSRSDLSVSVKPFPYKVTDQPSKQRVVFVRKNGSSK